MRLMLGDSRTLLTQLEGQSVDAIVCDPPYELGLGGKAWDASGIAYSVELWAECLRVLRPGGHLVAFGATRTYHRMACAIEDAGFEVRDSLSWLYGTGMPKSMDVAQAIDRQRYDRDDILKVTAWIRSVRDAAGVTNRAIDEAFGFNGMSSHWTSVKSQPSIPTLEQVPRLLEVLRVDWKQMPEDVARLLVDLNSRKGQPGQAWRQREVVGHHAVGSHIDRWKVTRFTGKRESCAKEITRPASDDAKRWEGWGTALRPACEPAVLARKPMPGRVADNLKAHGVGAINVKACHDEEGRWPANVMVDEEAGAIIDAAAGGEVARFFYSPKASTEEREWGKPEGAPTPWNIHPTVKPVDLMRWLCRLVTPPGGLVLDPFCGSGSTGVAAVLEGFGFIGCELDETHMQIAAHRIAAAQAGKVVVRGGKAQAAPSDSQLSLF
jgi:DNA modification methylase